MSSLKRYLSIFVFYSLLIHLSLVVSVYFWPKTGTNKLETSTEVEFVIDQAEVTKKSQIQRRKQIVEQQTQLNDEVPDDTEWLSAFNQRVVEETKASKSGEFKNADQMQGDLGKASQRTAETQRSLPENQIKSSRNKAKLVGPVDADAPNLNANDMTKEAKKSQAKKIDLADFAPQAKSIDAMVADLNQGSRGEASQTDDHLPEVATGLQTLLSSREFVYYAYYARIKDRIRQYWIPTVKQKIKIVQRSGREIASSNDRITQVVVILNKSGELVGVQIVGPSGVHDLDQAAVEAFQSAAPFPNPPHGMIEQDGFIRIRWDFVLEA